jgi:hypothetical protein
MEQDPDTSRPIIAPHEVQRLHDVIEDTIRIARHRSTDEDPILVRHTVYQGSPIEQELDMWLIDDNGKYGQLWLDTNGQLWYFSFGNIHDDIRVDMTTVSAPILTMYIRDVERFKSNL